MSSSPHFDDFELEMTTPPPGIPAMSSLDPARPAPPVEDSDVSG